MVRLVVCVFGIHVLKITVERWFWEVYMVFGSLVVLHVWLHSCLCFSLLEKLFFKSLLDTSLTPGYLSSFQAFFSYRNLDTSLTPGGSIEKVPISSTAFQNSFLRGEKHRYECNPTYNSTNDQINIKNSQNSLSI